MSDTIPLPASADAERAVLGGVMIDQALMQDQDVAVLEPDDFYADKHRALWRLLRQRDAANEPLDMVAVVEDLAGQNADDYGGFSYVASLVDHVPNVTVVPFMARSVRSMGTRRAMIAAAARLTARAYDLSTDLDELGRLSARTSQVLDDRYRAGSWHSYSDVVDDIYQRIEDHAKLEELPQVGLPCGPLSGLCVMEPGDTWAVAARTAMGKTGFVMGLTEAMARAGHGVAVVSLEMTHTKLVDRRLSRHTGISTKALRRGRHLDGRPFSGAEWNTIREAAGELANLPIMVDSSGGLTPQDIRSRCYQARRDLERRGYPLSCVVIDHLGLVKCEGRSPYERANVAADEMQALAKKLNVLVIEVVQLNRGAEGREPRIDDLRDSGKIEENARGIVLLYRPSERRTGIEADTWSGFGKVIVAKQNDGSTGSLWLDWLAVSGSWGDRVVDARDLPAGAVPGAA